MLDHEKLDVYQCSIEFLALSVQVIETLPKRILSLSGPTEKGLMVDSSQYRRRLWKKSLS